MSPDLWTGIMVGLFVGCVVTVAGFVGASLVLDYRLERARELSAALCLAGVLP